MRYMTAFIIAWLISGVAGTAHATVIGPNPAFKIFSTSKGKAVATKPDDKVTIRGAGGITVEASGKTVTITGSGSGTSAPMTDSLIKGDGHGGFTPAGDSDYVRPTSIRDLTTIPGFIVPIKSDRCPPSAGTLATLAAWGIDSSHIVCVSVNPASGNALPSGVALTISGGTVTARGNGTTTIGGVSVTAQGGSLAGGTAAAGTGSPSGSSLTVTAGTLSARGNGLIAITGATITGAGGTLTASASGSGTASISGGAVTAVGETLTASAANAVADTFSNSSLDSALWGTSNSGGSITETSDLSIATTATTQGALVYRKVVLSRGTAWAVPLKVKFTPSSVTSNSLMVALVEVASATTPAVAASGTILGNWVIGVTPKPTVNTYSILYRAVSAGAFQWATSGGTWVGTNQEFVASGTVMAVFSFDGTNITVSLKSADEATTYRSGTVAMSALNHPGSDLYLAFGDMYTDDSYGTLTISSYSGL